MTGRDLFFQCVEYADREGASDIHLYEGEAPTVRVQGILQEICNITAPDAEDMREILETIASERARERFLRDGESDFSWSAEICGKTLRLRVNVSVCCGKTLFVSRLLPEEIPTLAQLGLPDSLQKIAAQQNGLFLVTGRAGMGKSTTQAAMIEYVNMEMSKHIVTIEDPVEFLFTSKKSKIHQREVGADSVSFQSAITKSLRQDVDIILVGELRDLETIQAALTAAETGHLVLATLHARSAAQSVERIVDVFPGGQQNQIRAQLSLTLRGVISQQLVPALNGKRVAASELLLANHAVRNCIRECKTAQLKNIMQTGEGMYTMDRSLAKLYKQGRITGENMRRYSYDLKELESYLC